MHAPAQGLGFRASVSTCIMHHPPLVGWSTSRPRGCRCPHRGTGPRHCIRQGHRRCKLPPRRCQSGCMRCRHRSTRHSPGGRHITRVCIREGWHTHHCSMRLSLGTSLGFQNGTPPCFQSGRIVSQGWHTHHRGPHQGAAGEHKFRRHSNTVGLISMWGQGD